MTDYATPAIRGPRSRLVSVLRVILWIVWGLVLFGSFFFTIVIGITFAAPTSAPSAPPDPRSIQVLFFVSLFGSVVTISVAHLVRFFMVRIAFRRWSLKGYAWTYFICKLLTWFTCNGAVYFNLVICLIARSFLPTLPLAAILWLSILADPPLFRGLSRYKQGYPASDGMR